MVRSRGKREASSNKTLGELKAFIFIYNTSNIFYCSNKTLGELKVSQLSQSSSTPPRSNKTLGELKARIHSPYCISDLRSNKTLGELKVTMDRPPIPTTPFQ